MNGSDKKTKPPALTPKRSISMTNTSPQRRVSPGSAARSARPIRPSERLAQETEARGAAMAITLNHTIVPARDKAAATKFFAEIFGLKRARTGHFAPVRVNKELTLLFDDDSD